MGDCEESGKPGITEIQVRIDCNGCAQKIKKSLHGIKGICQLYVDFPQQKITVIGWADPDKIVRAIRKTRKIATIYSHTQQTTEAAPSTSQQPISHPQLPPQPEPEPEPEPPPQQPTTEPAPAPPSQPQPQPQPEPAASPNPSDVGEVHVVHHYSPNFEYRHGYPHDPPNQGYSMHPAYVTTPRIPPIHLHPYNSTHSVPHEPLQQPAYMTSRSMPWEPVQQPGYMTSHSVPREPLPPAGHVTHSMAREPLQQAGYVRHNVARDSFETTSNVTHSYNTHRPSPYVTAYEYSHAPPQHASYNRGDYYTQDYHNTNSNGNGNGNGNGNFTAMFSDENPNACTLM